MNKKEDKQNLNMAEVEKWMERFFLDPLTSYMDQIAFRIDLYETGNEIIVEALLSGFDPSKVSVYLKDNNLIIKAAKKEHSTKDNEEFSIRKVDFPFPVVQKDVQASFANEVLEVLISKNKKGSGVNRYLALP